MGSVWGDKAQERKRVHPCNVCDKAFKSLPMTSQHSIWQHCSHVFACKGCGKKFNPNNSINRHNNLVFGKPHHGKSFCHISMWGKDHHREDHSQSEHVGGGGEEEDGSGQLQEEDRLPLLSQMEIYYVGFKCICSCNLFFCKNKLRF